MDVLQLAAAGGGGAVVTWYVVHLLVRVIRRPEDIGAWLPRLMAGWHMGMAENEQARQDHEDATREREQRMAIAEASSPLVVAAETLKELPATESTSTADAAKDPRTLLRRSQNDLEAYRTATRQRGDS